MTESPLERLARRASTDPFFLGSRLAAYAQIHELDDTALASRLGCDPALLAAVRLCRAPRTDPTGFREDVLCVANRFGLNPRALAEATKQALATIPQERSAAQTPGVVLAARDRGDSS